MSWADVVQPGLDSSDEHDPRPTLRRVPTSTDPTHQLSWSPAYDRADVERYLAAIAEEPARLLAEIDAAEARIERGRARSVVLPGEATVAGFLLEAQRELEALEREHEATVTEILAAADRQAAAVLDQARADAEAVRAAAQALDALLQP